MILCHCKANPIPAKIPPFQRKITATVNILQQLEKYFAYLCRLTIQFYFGNAILSSILCWNLRTRNKQPCNDHRTRRREKEESVRWLIFHSNGKSMAQIAGHYLKKTVLPGCFVILYLKMDWRVCCPCLSGSHLQLTFSSCKDPGPILNSPLYL